MRVIPRLGIPLLQLKQQVNTTDHDLHGYCVYSLVSSLQESFASMIFKVSMNPPATIRRLAMARFMGLVLTPLRLLIEIFSNAFLVNVPGGHYRSGKSNVPCTLRSIAHDGIDRKYVCHIHGSIRIDPDDWKKNDFSESDDSLPPSYLLFIILDSILGNFIPAVAENSSAAETAQSLGRTIVYAGIRDSLYGVFVPG